jgi:inositol hexakisphosphate/diphosphoinositol-pentakisphosphate kinase
VTGIQVELTRRAIAQVKVLCKVEEERLVSNTIDEELPPYDQARALGKINMDVDRIAAGLPCGSEGFLVMFARWNKLE